MRGTLSQIARYLNRANETTGLVLDALCASPCLVDGLMVYTHPELNNEVHLSWPERGVLVFVTVDAVSVERDGLFIATHDISNASNKVMALVDILFTQSHMAK